MEFQYFFRRKVTGSERREKEGEKTLVIVSTTPKGSACTPLDQYVLPATPKLRACTPLRPITYQAHCQKKKKDTYKDRSAARDMRKFRNSEICFSILKNGLK